MNLSEFDIKLQDLNIAEKGRPFVCDGSPLECNTFLVGHNSATEGLFEDFWDPTNGGFRKKDWLERFQRDNEINKKTTRRRIELFFNEFNETNGKIRLLQTNLYCYPSSRRKDIPDEMKRSNVFNFLLKSIRPKAIIAHGKEINTYLWNLFGKGFKKNEWISVKFFGLDTKIYCIDHLAKPGVSDDDIANLAKELKADLLKILG